MSFLTADQIFLHLVGDYVLQSDWMATQKTSRNWPALCHAFCYSVPFLLLTTSISSFAVILVSHFLIDRFRLARFVVWAKNFLAPFGSNPPWDECSSTGYPRERPVWLSSWLFIIADNVLHLTCNGIGLLI